jgi:hypothetical protein
VRWTLWLIPFSLLLLGKMIFVSMDIHPRDPFEYEGAVLRQFQNTDSISVFMPVAAPEHRLQLDFYRKVKAEKTGNQVRLVESIDNIEINDQLILSPANLTKIENIFLVDTLRIWEGMGFEVKILGRK